ncbi:hypothetical protein MaudCBS49596_000314 [Microsporum audouinii]
MTEKETQYPVSQLGPTTVKEWKFLMERYLKAKDVWKVIEHATKIRKEQKVDVKTETDLSKYGDPTIA